MFQEPGRGVEVDVVWYPATDAVETEDRFVIRMDLSGVRREDIRIQLQDQMVSVVGSRRESLSRGGYRYHKMEIAKGPFARSIQVPGRFAHGKARATYEDGVLEISLTAPDRDAPMDIVVVELM
jgi:HSP20 family protein